MLLNYKSQYVINFIFRYHCESKQTLVFRRDFIKLIWNIIMWCGFQRMLLVKIGRTGQGRWKKVLLELIHSIFLILWYRSMCKNERLYLKGTCWDSLKTIVLHESKQVHANGDPQGTCNINWQHHLKFLQGFFSASYAQVLRPKVADLFVPHTLFSSTCGPFLIFIGNSQLPICLVTRSFCLSASVPPVSEKFPLSFSLAQSFFAHFKNAKYTKYVLCYFAKFV